MTYHKPGRQVRHVVCAWCGKPAVTRAVNGLYHPRCQQQAREARRLAKIRKAREEAQP